MNKLVTISTADALPAMALSETIPDPVLEIIEAHRAASAAYDKAVNHPAVGDSSHPDCKQATRLSDRTMRILIREANRLFKFSPTTASGLVTMLQYISSLDVWEMPGHFSEPREVKGLKALCAAMAAGLKRDGDLSTPSLAAGPDAELLGWIDQLWELVPRYRQVYAQYEAEEALWFKRRPSDDAEHDAAMTAAEIPYNQFQKEFDELERKVFSTRARTLAGAKAKAHWHLQFQCDGDINQLDGSHYHVESLFLELGGQIDPGLVPAAMTDLQRSHPFAVSLDLVDGEADRRPKSLPEGAVDPIFAAIEAHRNAYTAVVAGRAGLDDEAFTALSNKECAAAERVAETVPSTLEGLFSLLDYLKLAIMQQGDSFDLVFGNSTSIFASLAKAANALSGRAAIDEIGSGGCGEVIMALKPPARDPIFAAIEENRRTVKAFGEAVDLECALEASLPSDCRCSFIKAGDENIVESDDPAWLGALRARHEASNAMETSAIELLNTEPTTVAGVESLLRHFADQEEALFPDEVSDDDGSVEAFGVSLVRHVADSLRKIAGATEVA